MKRTFARQGLGYALRVPEMAIEMTIDHLGRRGGELFGEISVACAMPGTRSIDGYLHTAKFNVSGSTARGTLAKALTRRAGLPDIDWEDILEDFCRRILEAEREGDPTERVGALPMPVGVTTRLDPIMPLGDVTTIYGDGSTGKSTLAAAISVSVETGVTVIPGWVPRRAKVLYLDWEAGRDSINRRVRGVAMGANIPNVVTIAYKNCKRRGPLPGFAEDLAREVDGEGYGLVVVDSVGMAAGVGDGGDANETAIRLFAAFGALGTTVLAIDHVNKSDAQQNERRTRAYGSVYKGLLARATYEIRRAKAPDGRWTIGIYCTKFNDADELAPQALKVHHETDGAIAYERLEVMPDGLRVGDPPIWDLAREMLESGDYSESEIADAIGKSAPVVRSTLYRVAKMEGLVERLPSSKKWRLINRAG